MAKDLADRDQTRRRGAAAHRRAHDAAGVAPRVAGRLACRPVRRRHRPGPPGSARGVLGRSGTDGGLPPGCGRGTGRRPGPHRPRPAAAAGPGGRALPRTTSSPARQSTSSSCRRATSIERRPSRATSSDDREVADADTGLPRSQLSSTTGRRAAAIVGGGRVASRQPPTGGTAVPEPQRCDALQIQESQDRAQLGDPPLRRPGRDPTTFPQQERVHVRPGQTRRLEDPSRRRLL